MSKLAVLVVDGKPAVVDGATLDALAAVVLAAIRAGEHVPAQVEALVAALSNGQESSGVVSGRQAVALEDRSGDDESVKSAGLSRQQAAEYLGVSTSTLDRLRRSGRLLPAKVGHRVIYTRQQLEEHLNNVNGTDHEQGQP